MMGVVRHPWQHPAAALVKAALLLVCCVSASAAMPCPPAGARFKRNNAGFEAILESQGSGQGGWCAFANVTEGGKVGSYRLSGRDVPLDPVPKQASGPCPKGATAEYKIVVTEYRDPIQAGPDAAGRCLVQSERFGAQWMAPDEFRLGAPVGATATPDMDLSGTWRCSANGNIPIALLNMTGNRYTLTDADSTWHPKRGKLNGSGTIRPGKSGFVPESGPMRDELDVQAVSYHADRGRRALYLSNKPSGLALLQCLPAP